MQHHVQLIWSSSPGVQPEPQCGRAADPSCWAAPAQLLCQELRHLSIRAGFAFRAAWRRKNESPALLLLRRGTHLSSTVVLCFHQCVWKPWQRCTGARGTSMLYFSNAQRVWNILPYRGKYWLVILLWHFPSGLHALYPKAPPRVINYITRNHYDLGKIHLQSRIAACYCQLISGGIH